MSAPTSTSHPQFSDSYSTPAPSTDLPSSQTSSSTSSGGHRDWSLYQYFFGFIAVFILAGILVTCTCFRRRKRLAARRQNARQAVLARDLESASHTRHDVLRMGAWPFRRGEEEEGLNEAGEAPPPYKPGPDENDAALVQSGPPHSHDGTLNLTQPPPTLNREDTGLKPPDYTPTVVRPVPSSRTQTEQSTESDPETTSSSATNTNTITDTTTTPTARN